MKNWKLILLLGTGLATATPVHAIFEKKPPNHGPKFIIRLACPPQSRWLPSGDEDYVVTTNVTAVFKDDNVDKYRNIVSMDVIHETYKGKPKDRSEQYKNYVLENVVGGNEWRWSGWRWRRWPDRSRNTEGMTGTLHEHQVGMRLDYTYTEDYYVNGDYMFSKTSETCSRL